jgi:hypothetical protein
MQTSRRTGTQIPSAVWWPVLSQSLPARRNRADTEGSSRPEPLLPGASRRVREQLYGMTPAEQLDHASGVLSRVWTLRVALTEPARCIHKEAVMAKPWRCRLRLHRWQRLRSP